MILTKDLQKQIENELLKELPIRVKDNCIEYNHFLIMQDKDGYWCLYNNINGLDFLQRFFLRSCAIMAAKLYEKTKMQDFVTVKNLDSSYRNFANDIITFRHLIKKTNDDVKKDNYYFRLEECILKSKEMKRQIENLYRVIFR